MKRQILKTLAALLALLALAAGCAKEPQAAAPAGAEAEVSFTVSSPEIMTRAIADGNTVDKVDCYVYDSSGSIVVGDETYPISQTVDMTGGKAEFKVRLVTGQTYSFLFWAYKDGKSHYELDEATGKVTVSYTGAVSNDESRDAFYAYRKDVKIAGAVSETVTLKRPFAQVNFGTTAADIAAAKAAGIEVAKSCVKLTGLANELNLKDGSVSGNVTAEFAAAPLPADTEVLTVKGTDYRYVATNYVLVGAGQKSLSDVELKLYKENDATPVNTLKVPNAPLQGNYRTNIVGDLFTSQLIHSIVVGPDFDDPDYGWAGETQEPVLDGDTYLITTAAELAWVAEKVNAGTNNFSGKTVKLQDDINLFNHAWTPIGIMKYTPGKSFYGTLDGNGKTISNLNVTDTTPEWASAGLFGGTVSATVKDLNIENATVRSTHYAGVIVGYAQEGTQILNCKVSNVSVTSAAEFLESSGEWDNGDKAGAIAGHFEGIKIDGCTVKNATIQGYRDLGGIAGIVNYETGAVTNNALEGEVTINVDKTHNYNGWTDNNNFNAGAYVGRIGGALATVSGNTGEATIIYSQLTASTGTEFSDAVASVPADGSPVSITLSQDIAGDGVVAKAGQNIIVDMGGHTIDMTGAPVGSSGTQNQVFQLLKGSKVTLKNGTIKSNVTGVKMYIQNYSDLTLENVVLDASGNSNVLYVLSNNHGTVKIIGSTSILAAEGKTAFDVYYWPPSYADGVNVTVNTTGKIQGNIEYACANGYESDCAAKSSLVIENATLVNSKFNTDLGSPNMKIAKAIFADEEAAKAWLPSGYTLTTDDDYYKAIR